MSSPTPTELSKQLTAAGLEVFRVQAGRVHLADRVRENLIMDSGVSVITADPFVVRFVVRAQASHFSGESADALFARARGVAESSASRGYREVESAVVPIKDPGGGPGTLDTWYEVAFERGVEAEALVEELKYALGVEKSAGTG
ncbi:MAG TPA: hypothetical protein VH142_13130 [Polyangiaceae bacterium]|jgi:hypothetical protein|nr:hypothetical protein [Polyangiaceae bacterium]